VATNTPAPTNLEVLWQEIEHQKRLTTDLASQIQRVRRFGRVDELEAVSGKLEQESILIQNMAELSKAVTVLADTREIIAKRWVRVSPPEQSHQDSAGGT
jgi:hypothetical protein